MLAGLFTQAEIGDLLQFEMPRHAVAYTLAGLRAEGRVVESGRPGVGEREAYWRTHGVPPEEALARLTRTPVRVIADPTIPTGPFEDALLRMGFPPGDDAGFTVRLTTDYLQRGLSAFNERALSMERPWLLAKPTGPIAWLGPAFGRPDAPCWRCLAHRLRPWRDHEAQGEVCETANRIPDRPLMSPLSADHWRVAAVLLATHLAEHIAAPNARHLSGTLVSHDLAHLRTDGHLVPRRPQCPSCGDPDRHGVHPATPRFGGGAIPLTRGPPRRAQADEMDIQGLSASLVSPIMGIVRHVREFAPDPEEGPWVVAAEYARSRPETPDGDRGVRWRPVVAGAGPTRESALGRALAEAVERHSGAFQGNEPRIRARYVDLKDAIHPKSYLLFSSRQHVDRGEWNGRHRGFNHIPRPFDPGTPVDWTPVWSMTRRCTRYLPTQCLYYDYPCAPADRFCFADSNGCAAGRSHEDALARALLELIERDAVALWWYNRAPRPPFRTGARLGRLVQAVSRSLQRLGREWWSLDLTTDLTIPCAAAVSRKVEGPERVVFGFSAHPRPDRALERAALEMYTVALGVEEAASVGNPEFEAWLERANTRAESYVLPAHRAEDGSPAADQPVRDGPVHGGDAVDLSTLVRIVEERGLEVLALDQTRSDMPLPVVRAVVPGLRHFWARFAPGRLYDAPARLGWVDAVLSEHELNPIPFFL